MLDGADLAMSYCNKKTVFQLLFQNGREDRIRTCDLMVPNHAHYQAVLLLEIYGTPKGIRTPSL